MRFLHSFYINLCVENPPIPGESLVIEEATGAIEIVKCGKSCFNNRINILI